MFPIIKKELKQYFDHPTAYILLVVFLVVNGFFYFRGILVQNIADLRPMFEFLPWILLFFVPAITMRMISEERRSGTLELEMVQPVKPWVIFAGKILASVIFVVSGLVLTVLIPISLSVAGSFDVGQTIAQYIAAIFLVLGMSSVGVFASSVTKSQSVSFILAIGIGFFFIISGSEVVTVEFTGNIRNVLAQLSLLAHYNNMVRGVIDFRDVLYFVTFSLSFASVGYVLLVRPLMNPKRREFRQLKLGVVGIVVISLLLNVLGSNIPGRIDLTKGKIYTLAPATKQALKELDDIVTIKVFESENLPPQIALMRRDVHDMVNDFERTSGGNIRVEYVIANENSDEIREAQSLGVAPVQFNVVNKQELSVKQGLFGVSVLYLDEYETIPFIDSTSGLEYQLISFIKKLTSSERKTVGFVAGHGEKSAGMDFATYASALREQYDVLDINLTNDDVTDIDVMVVAGPSMEFQDSEKDVLRKFISGGGAVLFLIDTVNVNLQTLQAFPNQYSLSDIVSEYGVQVKSDIVFDVRSNESVTFGGGLVSYVLPYPFWARVPVVPDNPIAGDVPSIVMPWASSLVVTGDKYEYTNLFMTTQFAGSQSETFNLSPDQRIGIAEDDLGEKLMAVAVNLSDENKQPQSDNQEKVGRIVVIGDSDFLTEQFARGAGARNNLVFGINAIDWLAQDEALIGIRSKNRQPDTLVFEDEGSMSRIRLFNIMGVPALVIVYGIIRIYRRKKMADSALDV